MDIAFAFHLRKTLKLLAFFLRHLRMLLSYYSNFSRSIIRLRARKMNSIPRMAIPARFKTTRFIHKLVSKSEGGANGLRKR